MGTDYLFAMPKFITGMASAMDLGATLTQFNTSRNGEEADRKAIRNDWIVVGNDIRGVLIKMGKDEQ
jgi:hypothetical protein